ncbi:GTP cyclohydrolase FolE2 [Neisseria sp. Ec49-e6-T10]|uniref:GTP cyclohydrolase FolE2 n=1 Tax=Neisseria sp. Ec49-e6-T10 TaxID=3140744 RepID=UPI003EBD3441
MSTIADVQSSHDTRNLAINQVGIKNLRMPLNFKTQGKVHHTVAHFTMTVFLPAHLKGTHMSRFVELLEGLKEPLSFEQFKQLNFDMLKKLDSTAGKISATFPFFRYKTAPVSGVESLLDYDVSLIGEIIDGIFHYTLKVLVPVTSLCPCSKEISQYGAHNQRSHVTLTIQTTQAIEVEELIDVVEQQASCELYGLLKRPDEKFVTERAYENPKFVEDMVRDVAALLLKDKRIEKFMVESENFESIHNHSAYAYIQHP